MPSSAAVAVARDADEFIGLARERLERPATEDERRAISESVKEETWEAKVRRLLALISEVP